MIEQAEQVGWFREMLIREATEKAARATELDDFGWYRAEWKKAQEQKEADQRSPCAKTHF